MLYITLSLIGIVSTLLIRPKWSLKVQIFFVLSTIILGFFLFSGYGLLFKDSPMIAKSGSSFWNQTPWLEVILYFAMLLGMSAKFLYDGIVATGSNRRKKLRLLKRELFKPMLVSPMVFISIYGVADEKTSTVLLFLFSFQNGFFWQTVLNKSTPPTSS